MDDDGEANEAAAEVAALSALYMSCKRPMTEVSPTVSRKKKVSTVDDLIILSKGIARSRRPNLGLKNQSKFLKKNDRIFD